MPPKSKQKRKPVPRFSRAGPKKALKGNAARKPKPKPKPKPRATTAVRDSPFAESFVMPPPPLPPMEPLAPPAPPAPELPPLFTDSEKQELLQGMQSLSKISVSVSMSAMLRSLDSAYTSLAIASKPVVMDQVRLWWSQSNSDLEQFQQLLRGTKDWASGVVNHLFERLGHTEYMERLLDLASVIEQKVLYLTLNMSAKVIKLPDSRRLFHGFLKMAAQHLFMNPFLAKIMCESNLNMATATETFLQLAKSHWQAVVFEAVSKSALLSPSPLLGEQSTEPLRPPQMVQHQAFVEPPPPFALPSLKPPVSISALSDEPSIDLPVMLPPSTPEPRPQVQMLGMDSPERLGTQSLPSALAAKKEDSVSDSESGTDISTSDEEEEDDDDDLVSESESSGESSGSGDDDDEEEETGSESGSEDAFGKESLSAVAPPPLSSNAF